MFSPLAINMVKKLSSKMTWAVSDVKVRTILLEKKNRVIVSLKLKEQHKQLCCDLCDIYGSRL